MTVKKEMFLEAVRIVRARAKTNQEAIAQCKKNLESLHDEIAAVQNQIRLLEACEREDTLLADVLEGEAERYA